MSNSTDAQWDTLAKAIVMKAFYDYKDALINGNGGSCRQLVRFFHSGWYDSLTSIDGDRLIAAAKRQAVYDKWRCETGCKKCLEYKCGHCNAKLWHREKWTCPKQGGGDESTIKTRWDKTTTQRTYVCSEKKRSREDQGKG